MSNETTLTVRGIAGTTPQLAHTKDHGAWTRFRLACTRSRRAQDGSWEDAETLWFTIRAYRHLATRVAQSVRAGFPLMVRGRLVDDTYVDREGVTRQGTAIHADAVAIDVAAFGVVTFERLGPPRESASSDDDSTEADRSGWAAMGPGHPDLSSTLGSGAGSVDVTGLPEIEEAPADGDTGAESEAGGDPGTEPAGTEPAEASAGSAGGPPF